MFPLHVMPKFPIIPAILCLAISIIMTKEFVDGFLGEPVAVHDAGRTSVHVLQLLDHHSLSHLRMVQA